MMGAYQRYLPPKGGLSTSVSCSEICTNTLSGCCALLSQAKNQHCHVLRLSPQLLLVRTDRKEAGGKSCAAPL
jgi:hypothetical protein